MNKDIDALFSEYVIDGALTDATPADMLKECICQKDWERIFAGRNKPVQLHTVVDETSDHDPAPFKYDPGKVDQYLADITKKLKELHGQSDPVNRNHPFSSARILVAESILKAIWKSGVFELEELSLGVSWFWDSAPVGNMAAFYNAVQAVSEYVYDLGLHIKELQYAETAGKHDVSIKSISSPATGTDMVPATVKDEEDSVLIYVPFDTCSYKLGGSLLGDVLSQGDEGGPEIMDPDYFIDCFEVVHELVEDGIVLSGVAVGRGGLMAAVDRILGDGHCINMDINGIKRACAEPDSVRVLFAEIPGIVLQINGTDFDYVDSQFLLQDIAYYPVGEPVNMNKVPAGRQKIRLTADTTNDLSRILAALMSGQSSEGED